jgi:hypothetical protein
MTLFNTTFAALVMIAIGAVLRQRGAEAPEQGREHRRHLDGGQAHVAALRGAAKSPNSRSWGTLSSG